MSELIERLKDQIMQFGDGTTEFHTRDITALINMIESRTELTGVSVDIKQLVSRAFDLVREAEDIAPKDEKLSELLYNTLNILSDIQNSTLTPLTGVTREQIVEAVRQHTETITKLPASEQTLDDSPRLTISFNQLNKALQSLPIPSRLTDEEIKAEAFQQFGNTVPMEDLYDGFIIGAKFARDWKGGVK